MNSKDTNLLTVKGLKKYFPVTAGILRREVNQIKAVDDIDFTIGRGQVLGMVGESGSGKSTAGRATTRLIEPTAGQIYFKGQDIMQLQRNQMLQLRRQIQIIFQDPLASLNPRQTIGEALAEPLRYHGIINERSQERQKVVEILEKVGLRADAIDRYPHQFSGGQQQRICIGRALVLNPELIICDEALSALDISIQAQILNLLMELRQSLGLSYLYISHDLGSVRHICDHVVVLYLGKVMESASAHDLFANPKHPYTQALLAAKPARHPKQRKTLLPLKGEIPSPLNPPSGCPFRTRCPYAQPICAEPPPKQQIGNDHTYYCILKDD